MVFRSSLEPEDVPLRRRDVLMAGVISFHLGNGHEGILKVYNINGNVLEVLFNDSGGLFE